MFHGALLNSDPRRLALNSVAEEADPTPVQRLRGEKVAAAKEEEGLHVS